MIFRKHGIERRCQGNLIVLCRRSQADAFLPRSPAGAWRSSQAAVQAMQGVAPARGDVLMHEGAAAVEDPVGLANKGGHAGGTPSSNGAPAQEQKQAPIDPDDDMEEDEEVRSKAWLAQSCHSCVLSGSTS